MSLYSAILTLAIADKLSGRTQDHHFTDDPKVFAQRHHGQLNPPLEWRAVKSQGGYTIEQAVSDRYVYTIGPLVITDL